MARIDVSAFVDAWCDVAEQGGSQSDVARLLGCSSANVSIRAKKLIEAGVELPELVAKRTHTLDISGLNDRIRDRLN